MPRQHACTLAQTARVRDPRYFGALVVIHRSNDVVMAARRQEGQRARGNVLLHPTLGRDAATAGSFDARLVAHCDRVRPSSRVRAVCNDASASPRSRPTRRSRHRFCARRMRPRTPPPRHIVRHDQAIDRPNGQRLRDRCRHASSASDLLMECDLAHVSKSRRLEPALILPAPSCGRLPHSVCRT